MNQDGLITWHTLWNSQRITWADTEMAYVDLKQVISDQLTVLALGDANGKKRRRQLKRLPGTGQIK